jgi:peptidoglycan/xylan/chitin deacetylase (PgdA/CDA1 family)
VAIAPNAGRLLVVTAMAGGDLAILCYHAVSDAWPGVGAVEPKALDRQVRHLLRRGYRPLTLSAALAADPAERRLAVTFDDAFHSVLERGLPVLERLGAPATLFVPTDFASEAAPMTWSTLGQWVGTAHEDELRCMSWDDVRDLAGAGWEVGSHTCSHPKLTAIDRAEAAAELTRSKQVCEAEVDSSCASLAYPFGLHDRGVVELARSAGYERAVTLGDRLLGPRSRKRPLELSREGIYRTTRWPHFLAATSPVLGRVRTRGLYRRLAPA